MSFSFEKLLRGSQLGMGNFTTPVDAMDTSETVYITPLALMKMVRHAKQGIPLEVMGLMLGTFVDNYKIQVVDVFWMPQQATGINVESVDPVFQTDIMAMLSATGRKEKVVGWYHSHPGFGCWLSSIDVSTAQVFEKELPRSVSVVIDPVQSVKGKIVIEAFRTNGEKNHASFFGGYEIRQTTSNECIKSPKSSYSSLITNAVRQYYSLNICFDISPQEKRILNFLDKSEWPEWNTIADEFIHIKDNNESIKEISQLTKPYKTIIESEASNNDEISKEQVGKVDAKTAIEKKVVDLINSNFRQSVTTLINRLSTI